MENILSTHDLTWRSTRYSHRHHRIRSSFNSRPHVEVDEKSIIQETRPAIFQLTTSRGGRRIDILPPFCSDSFNSRPHVEVDTATALHKLYPISFQLTTSRGGRRSDYRLCCESCSFNSRPHVEVDYLEVSESVDEKLSTHDLTWRSTATLQAARSGCSLSTHDLTWRSTIRAVQCYVPRADFQLTTSRGGRRRKVGDSWWPDHFQLTTSRGGRPSVWSQQSRT